jgi:hypothetical protein
LRAKKWLGLERARGLGPEVLGGGGRGIYILFREESKNCDGIAIGGCQSAVWLGKLRQILCLRRQSKRIVRPASKVQAFQVPGTHISCPIFEPQHANGSYNQPVNFTHLEFGIHTLPADLLSSRAHTHTHTHTHTLFIQSFGVPIYPTPSQADKGPNPLRAITLWRRRLCQIFQPTYSHKSKLYDPTQLLQAQVEGKRNLFSNLFSTSHTPTQVFLFNPPLTFPLQYSLQLGG